MLNIANNIVENEDLDKQCNVTGSFLSLRGTIEGVNRSKSDNVELKELVKKLLYASIKIEYEGLSPINTSIETVSNWLIDKSKIASKSNKFWCGSADLMKWERDFINKIATVPDTDSIYRLCKTDEYKYVILITNVTSRKIREFLEVYNDFLDENNVFFECLIFGINEMSKEDLAEYTLEWSCYNADSSAP